MGYRDDEENRKARVARSEDRRSQRAGARDFFLAERLNVGAPSAAEPWTAGGQWKGLAIVALIAVVSSGLLVLMGPFVAPRVVAPLLCPHRYVRSYQRVTMHTEAGVVTNELTLMCVTGDGEIAVGDLALYGVWGCAGGACFLSTITVLAIAERRMRQRRGLMMRGAPNG
jgi:hypothetical protein